MSSVFKEFFLGKKEIIIEGDVVFPGEVKNRKLGINRGMGIINSIDSDQEADVVIEDGLIFPGFIDLHVHAREDQSREWNYKEDYSTAGRAALAGGVTVIGDMPNTPVPLVDGKGFKEKHVLSRYSGMEVLLYVGIGPCTNPLSRKVPYKVFMGKSVGDLFFKSEKELRGALAGYKGEAVSFHCEDPVILKEHEKRGTHRERRPPEAEVRGVELALGLIEEYELSGKLCHISTKEGLDLVEVAKKRGVEVQLETTPHHLLLEDNGEGIEFPECLKHKVNIPPPGFFQVNPPIREKGDREAIFRAFREGRIDFLATDHAPHTIKEKEQGVSGLPHLDTYGNVVGCLLEMRVPPEVLGKAGAYNPGVYLSDFGFTSREMDIGSLANLTVLVKQTEEILREGLFTKAGWSPFEGRVFPWRVEFTVLRGRIWKKKSV